MKFSKLIAILNKEAFITLAPTDLSKTYYEGKVKNIPHTFEDYEVEDCCVSYEGNYLLKIKEPAYHTPSSVSTSLWREGRLELRGTTYHYWAKVYEQGSVHGINGGRVSKLTITNEQTNRTEANYDRGWDISPRNKTVQRVVDLIVADYQA